MKIRRDIFSFRNRVVVIIVGVSLGMVSLLYTNNMAKRLKEKEQHDVALCIYDLTIYDLRLKNLGL